MKYYLIITILLLPNFLFPQEDFISDKYNFKITFPAGWEVKGEKNNIIVEGTKKNYVSLYIQTQKLDVSDSLTIIYLPIDTLELQVENRYASKYTYYEVMKYGQNVIDFVDAYYFFIRYAGETEGFTMKYVSYQYQLVYKKYFYSLIATCPEKNFEKNEKEFNQIFSTFKFLNKNP